MGSVDRRDHTAWAEIADTCSVQFQRRPMRLQVAGGLELVLVPIAGLRRSSSPDFGLESMV
jgi:hypothetical protein